MREQGHVECQPACQNGRNRDQPGQASPPGDQADQDHRQDNGGCRVGQPRAPVAAQAIAGQQMRDRRRDHLDARHHRVERGREDVAATGDGGADDDHLAGDGGPVEPAGQDVGRAEGGNGAARAVKADRQEMAEIGGDPVIREHDVVLGNGRVLPERQRGGPQHQRRLEPIAGPEDQRLEPRRAALVGGDVDDAQRGGIEERGLGQQEALSDRHAVGGASPAGDPLAAAGEQGSAGNHAVAGTEGCRQRLVAGRRPPVDQQHVERDRLRLQRPHGSHQTGQRGARQRVAAFAQHGPVVDGHDGDHTGRRAAPAQHHADVGQRRLDAVEEPGSAADMLEAERGSPGTGQDESEKHRQGAPAHGRHCPRRSSSALARARDQRFTVSGPLPGSTSTPWPTPSVTG